MSFAPPLYKYKQDFLGVWLESEGLPGTFHIADGATQPINRPTDSFLRLHADGHFGVEVGIDNPPPDRWWMEFSCWIMSVWTQDSAPAYARPGLESGADVLGAALLRPTVMVPLNPDIREIVRFDTDDDFVLTRARKPDGSVEGGGQLTVYLALRDPLGAVSTLNEYSVTLYAQTYVRQVWGSVDPVV